MTTRACKGCGSTTRALPCPGPRCATCGRAAKKRTKSNAWARGIWSRYLLSEDAYWLIYAAQGGRCALCAWASGKTKRLAVDHDHACCPETPTCGSCTRGLLCGPCNQWLGRMRDQVAYGLRFVAYLEAPPAKPYLTKAESAAALINPFGGLVTPGIAVEAASVADKGQIQGWSGDTLDNPFAALVAGAGESRGVVPTFTLSTSAQVAQPATLSTTATHKGS